MFVRKLGFFFLCVLTFAAAPLNGAIEFKDSGQITVVAQTNKEFRFPLRDLLKDIGSGDLTWTVLGQIPPALTAWLSVNTGTELMLGTPNSQQTGSNAFNITVRDNQTSE